MRKKTTVEIIKDSERYKQISADFIYNRFDLQNNEDCQICLLRVTDEEKAWYIPVQIHNDTALLGISLAPISEEELQQTIKFIFRSFRNVRKIQYYSGCSAKGISIAHNYYTIVLPEELTELKERSSAKTRQTLRRKIRIIERELGEFSVKEFSANDVPKQIIEDYFLMKKATHDTDYGLSAEEYLNKYYVTNIYVMYLKEEVGAIVFSCEQCAGVYLENLSYQVKYAKYSLGQILYDIYLEKLVLKGKKEVFLSGGDLGYKKRYGSTEHWVYDCTVFRSGLEEYGSKAVLFGKRVSRFLLRHVRKNQEV